MAAGCRGLGGSAAPVPFSAAVPLQRRQACPGRRVCPGDSPHPRAGKSTPPRTSTRRRSRARRTPKAGRARLASGVVAATTPSPSGSREVRRLRGLDDDALLLRSPADAPTERAGRPLLPVSRPVLRPDYRPGARAVIRRTATTAALGRTTSTASTSTLSSPGLSRRDSRPDRGFPASRLGVRDHPGPSQPRPSLLVSRAQGLFFLRPYLSMAFFVLNSSPALQGQPPAAAELSILPSIAFAVHRPRGGAADGSVPAAASRGAGSADLPARGRRGAGEGAGGGSSARRQARALRARLPRCARVCPDPGATRFAQIPGSTSSSRDAPGARLPLGLPPAGSATNEPWDAALIIWTPDFVDPFGYINRLLDGQLAGGTDLARFDEPPFYAQMQQASRLQGAAREAYAELDLDSLATPHRSCRWPSSTK